MKAASSARKSPVGFRLALPSEKLIRLIPAMAATNPRKNGMPSGSFSRETSRVSMAVKNGAVEMITPTLDAWVIVREMFSSR